jgi:hypothetical protein
MMLQASVTASGGVTRPAAVTLLRQLRGKGVTKLVFEYLPQADAAADLLELRVRPKDSSDSRTAVVPLVTEK